MADGEQSGASGGSHGSGGLMAKRTSSATPVPHVGRVLDDRWEVGHRIGTGGMASVHAGHDRRLTRPVAVKILHHHIAENPDARERLAREARAIAQLKHENVIEVYDYSIDDENCTWLVSELIEGYSLRQFLDRNEAPPAEIAVMITTEVVRALKAAHAVGVIHRDVKPDNILIGAEQGRPKLTDFGIAKVMSETKMTMTGNLVGSPSYMSPEQADGQTCDHRTDLFSTGILLYRLVTGTLPFIGTTPIDTIRKVSLGEYIDPMELSAALPEQRRRDHPTCARARNMEERYQTADEMLADLGLVLEDAGLTATWSELPKFFADPAGYYAALKPTLAQRLEARGKTLLESGEESRAVDCFNRAISLGEGSQNTVDLVRQLSKRRSSGRVRKILWAATLAIGGLVAIAGVILVTDVLTDRAPPPIANAQPLDVKVAADAEEVKQAEAEPPAKAVTEKAETKPEVEAAAPIEAPVAAPTPKKQRKRTTRPRRKRAAKAVVAPPPAPKKVETAPPAPKPDLPKYGTLHVGTQKWADVYVDGKKVGRAPDRTQYPLPPGEHRLRAEKPNSNCLPFERTFNIQPGKTTRIRLKVICP